MKHASFRLKVTVLSVTILLVALVGFGAMLSYSTLARMSQFIDQELVNRAEGTARRPRLGPEPMPGGRPRPPGQGPRPMFQAPPERLLNREGGNYFRDNLPVFDPIAARKAVNGTRVFSEVMFEGRHIRTFSMPIHRPGEEVAGVQVARDLTDYDQIREMQTRTQLIFLPIAALLAGFGAYILATRTIKPIAQLSAAAKEIGEGNLGHRLRVEGNDELAQLGRSFNQMAGNVEENFERLREMYERQQRFTADASHELRTPLTRVKLAISNALNDQDADLRGALATADAGTDSMIRLVGQLLALAKADAGELGLQPRPIDLRLCCSDAIQELPAGGERVTPAFPDHEIVAEADPDSIRRVVVNLLENALRHSNSDQPVALEVSADGGFAMIRVRDSGEGIPAEALPRIGERFFRVDTARSRKAGGSGLGLSISRALLAEQGGSLEIESQAGQGTIATVRLPLTTKKAANTNEIQISETYSKAVNDENRRSNP